MVMGFRMIFILEEKRTVRKLAVSLVTVTYDLPVKIVEELLPELTAPIAAIYREVLESHSWP